MKVLVLGANGQLGQSIKRVINETNISDVYIFGGRDICDIRYNFDVRKAFDEYKPDIVINCAAYTNVDKAETDFDEAFNANVIGPKNLAECCKSYGIHLIHISTDYVFSDNMKFRTEESPTKPCNAYGATKEMGERAIQFYMKDNYTIIRTSWLYSEFGNNFITKILAKAKNGDVAVVEDEIGYPTYAVEMARKIVKLIESRDYEHGEPIYHFTDGETVSRYQFASTACELYGITNKVNKCKQSDFKTAAKRPQWAPLDKNIVYGGQKHWKETLTECINEIKKKESVTD